MQKLRGLGVAAIIMALALSGCTEAPSEPEPVVTDGDAEIAEDGRDLRFDLTQDDVIGSPEWEVGDWFGHHVFLGEADEEGIHINAVVASADATSYELVTDNEEMAKVEAMFDIPILGTVSSSDLSTQSFGQPWKVYDFPMSHGHEWTVDFGLGQDVTFEARYNAAITTPYGERPGFDVIGTFPDGTLVMATDYVPDIGWYSFMKAYNLFTEDPEDFDFLSISMGRGHDWTGTYYIYRGSLVVDHFGFQSLFVPEQSQPAHYETFQVEDADILIGFMFAFSAQGASEVRLRDPNNQMYSYPAVNVEPNPDPSTWQGTQVGTPNDSFWEVAAVPGEWSFSQISAGAVAGGGGSIWALSAEQVDLLPS